jgi:two-component sensor histidine kinase
MLSTLQRGIQDFNPETGVFTRVGGVLQQGLEPPDPRYFLNLPSNDIAATQVTQESKLLTFTFNGLVLHGPRQQTSLVFTTEDGLGDDEFNTASCFYNDRDQRWYAGGINGFVSFKVEDLLPEVSPYQPALTSYRILDEEVGYETVHYLPAGWEGPLVLSPSVVYCTFDFTVPDFFAEGDRSYQTFLEGFDPDWTSQTTSPFVRYTQLNPGDYDFHLQAFDGEGRKTTEMREIRVSVLKPWNQSYWFYAACAACFCLLIFGIYQYRLNRLKARMETTRRFQSLELRSLRQQLNPHFISNAMNAIREYIQREETDDAAKYLTDFSLMMRLFLESSRRRFTTVADEANMLSRYINLEQLRFPDCFTCQITIDEDIDPDMDEVPSLLLQPIVENAINHGLRPLNNGGELKIDFRLDPDDDDVLICTISDNGVGRKISALKTKPASHVSRATQILADRQNLLAENERIELSVIITDLYPDREHTGTVVTLRMEAVGP